MEFLSLGKITDSFGLDGTLKIYSTTSNAALRYQKGKKVFLYNEATKERADYTVLNYRHNGLFDLVKLEEITTCDDALSKKGYEIIVEKNVQDLDKNTYFFTDLIGCEIVDNFGKKLGFVKEIEEFPAQITIRGGRQGKPDFFVPFIEEFVNKVDIENKTIVINVIEGLLW